MAAGEPVELQVFVENLPKVELHAHINGSVSRSTLKKLMQLKHGNHENAEDKQVFDNIMSQSGTTRTLSQVFETFKLIHKLCDCEEAAYMVTRDVITEFAADNVKLLELRTTPRAEAASGMTKESYIESVIRGIKECQNCGIDCDVKLLLSVDRKRDLRDACDTVKLAEAFTNKHPGLIVGVGLSGDPVLGNVKDLLPVFEDAKRKGLNTTLHISEITERNEETMSFLGLPPDRIGHGTYVHPDVGGSQEILDTISAKKIPIEACITSNICCETVQSALEHHFGYWFKKGHPCTLCTDDKGVFDTSLSKEYLVAANAFSLSREQLYNISYSAIDVSFADEDTKEKMRNRWRTWKKDHEAWFEHVQEK